MEAIVHAADVQDRDGGVLLMNFEIVRRCDAGKFVVLPKRWIVERTIAWLNRCRRLSGADHRACSARSPGVACRRDDRARDAGAAGCGPGQ